MRHELHDWVADAHELTHEGAPLRSGWRAWRAAWRGALGNALLLRSGELVALPMLELVVVAVVFVVAVVVVVVGSWFLVVGPADAF